MGGANGDWRQLVPLCNNDHREHEKIYTKGILDVYDVDLAKAAAILVAAHLQELGISDDTTPQEAHRQ